MHARELRANFAPATVRIGSPAAPAAAELAEFASSPERYSIPSSLLAARYNSWRAANGLRDPVTCKSFTMKMVSHGSGYGISRDTTGNRHNTFLIDADKIKAALALPKGPA